MPQEKYHLKLPPYPGTSQCVKICGGSGGKSDPSQLRLNYDLAEKGGGLLEEHVDADPMKQFDKWFQVCSVLPSIRLSQEGLESASNSCVVEVSCGSACSGTTALLTEIEGTEARNVSKQASSCLLQPRGFETRILAPQESFQGYLRGSCL